MAPSERQRLQARLEELKSLRVRATDDISAAQEAVTRQQAELAKAPEDAARWEAYKQSVDNFNQATARAVEIERESHEVFMQIYSPKL
jgi:hypothetical protein